MNLDFLKDGPSGPVIVLSLWLFAAAVDTMPAPRPGDFYYLWCYQFLHFLAANISKIKGPPVPVQDIGSSKTTTGKDAEGNEVRLVETAMQKDVPVPAPVTKAKPEGD